MAYRLVAAATPATAGACGSVRQPSSSHLQPCTSSRACSCHTAVLPGAWAAHQASRLSGRGGGGTSTTACRAVAPEALQDIIVFGSVFGAVGVALYSGLKKEPVPCGLCQGIGGVRCFGCGGNGKMESSAKRDELYDMPAKRDVLGRSINPRECKVCKGVGLVLCSQCSGTGYQGA